MSLETLGSAITGLQTSGVKYELCNADLAGKKHEHKTILISVPEDVLGNYHNKADDSTIREFVKHEERDGWVARIDDMRNHKTWSEKGADNPGDVLVDVSFHRYVDAQRNMEG
jgi:hypothetical protein